VTLLLTIEKSRLLRRRGAISDEAMRQVDTALRLSLNLVKD